MLQRSKKKKVRKTKKIKYCKKLLIILSETDMQKLQHKRHLKGTRN